MGERIRSYRDLRVYRHAVELDSRVYVLTHEFPARERYGVTSQVTRAAGSVCANIAEAWRKRRYRAAFVAKLSDSETEACETQVWLELATSRGFMEAERTAELIAEYEQIIAQLVKMIDQADKWLIKPRAER